MKVVDLEKKKTLNEGFAHIGSIRAISSCKYNKSSSTLNLIVLHFRYVFNWSKRQLSLPLGSENRSKNTDSWARCKWIV